MNSLNKVNIEDEIVENTLKVLDYSKANKKWFDERGFVAGYHSFTLNNKFFKGQRNIEERMFNIDEKYYEGKNVLDIGCSTGGLLYFLSDKINKGVGLDFNTKCINAANMVRNNFNLDNVSFYTFDLDKENLNLINSFTNSMKVDLCFFMNLSLWVKKWKEAFIFLAEITEVMVFEAHGNPSQQEEQLSFIKSVYREVELVNEQSSDDESYLKRSMYICKNRIIGTEIKEEHQLSSYDIESIGEFYKQFFGIDFNEIHKFSNTHESHVFEIDGYILKFPRTKDHSYINKEIKVTQLLKNIVSVNIPEIYIYETNDLWFCRYEKVDGYNFNLVKYEKLSEETKNKLALQLSNFMNELHKSTNDVSEKIKDNLQSSWSINLERIGQEFNNSKIFAIEGLLVEIVNNHKNLFVNEQNLRFGHFDLHGSNLLLDKEHSNLIGVIDFGNAKFGDIHQDFSSIALSSIDFMERVIVSYEKISNRNINKLLVYHYVTIFYLNLLAGLKSKNAKNYETWLNKYQEWYIYLVKKKAEAVTNTYQTNLPKKWVKWITKAELKNISHLHIFKVLHENGYSGLDTATALLELKNDPCFELLKETDFTLRKREWLIDTVDQLARLNPAYSQTIDRISTPDFQYFMNYYYSRHLPVVLTDAIENWEALKKWSPEYFYNVIGDTEVEVQYGREKDPLFERNAGKYKTKMLMKDFIEEILSVGSSNNLYMTANNTKRSFDGIGKLFNDIGVFGRDYTNSERIHEQSYLWLGPKGTFTPLHHDLTNNLLVQIYGRKKITLIPALQVQNLYNDRGVFSEIYNPENLDEKEIFKLLGKTSKLEYILNPGESIFIPVGWWHYVESLDTSISLTLTNIKSENGVFSRDFVRF